MEDIVDLNVDVSVNSVSSLCLIKLRYCVYVISNGWRYYWSIMLLLPKNATIIIDKMRYHY